MKKILIFIVLSVIALGCHKYYNDDRYTPSYIKNDIKCLAFSPGTYWIYWSDSLQQIDSSFIKGVKSDFYDIYYGLGEHIEWEYFEMTCKFGFPSIYSKAQLHLERNHMLIDPKLGQYGYYGPAAYSFDTAYDWSQRQAKYRYLDSLLVGNQYFHQVQECKFPQYSDSITYYTAPGIGIIRKIITVDSVKYTWDLIRWRKASN